MVLFLAVEDHPCLIESFRGGRLDSARGSLIAQLDRFAHDSNRVSMIAMEDKDRCGLSIQPATHLLQVGDLGGLALHHNEKGLARCRPWRLGPLRRSSVVPMPRPH